LRLVKKKIRIFNCHYLFSLPKTCFEMMQRRNAAPSPLQKLETVLKDHFPAE